MQFDFDCKSYKQGHRRTAKEISYATNRLFKLQFVGPRRNKVVITGVLHVSLKPKKEQKAIRYSHIFLKLELQ